MAWKVWFDDNTTYDSTQGAVTTVPNKGIVAVAVSGQPVYKDQDWYLYTPSLGFRAVSLEQLLYQVTNNPDNLALVRQGALVDDTTYNTIITAANAFV